MSAYDYSLGNIPALISIPHMGLEIADEIKPEMTAAASQIADTDWHLDRLYDFATELGFHRLQARYSRYVIDLNRPRDNRPLYEGANNTELVPSTSFDQQALYLPQHLPTDAEIERRRLNYWQPYHDKLQQTLNELLEKYGVVVLFDCHSIKSMVPRFFDGRLADFNLGTAESAACDEQLRQSLISVLSKQQQYSLAVDGRFTGGYITRHYGDPKHGVHAFQMELSQATYMQEMSPYNYDEQLAHQVQPHLHAMLLAVVTWLHGKMKI